MILWLKPSATFSTRYKTFVSVDCLAAAEHLSRSEVGIFSEYRLVDFETFKAGMFVRDG